VRCTASRVTSSSRGAASSMKLETEDLTPSISSPNIDKLCSLLKKAGIAPATTSSSPPASVLKCPANPQVLRAPAGCFQWFKNLLEHSLRTAAWPGASVYGYGLHDVFLVSFMKSDSGMPIASSVPPELCVGGGTSPSGKTKLLPGS
jgi:hypothetical protein